MCNLQGNQLIFRTTECGIIKVRFDLQFIASRFSERQRATCVLTKASSFFSNLLSAAAANSYDAKTHVKVHSHVEMNTLPEKCASCRKQTVSKLQVDYFSVNCKRNAEKLP